MDKKDKIKATLDKLKMLSDSSYKRGNYENVLKLTSIYADICYQYNQVYKDEYIEEVLLDVKKRILKNSEYEPNPNIVLFYDGFGLDLRGWAASYSRALTSLGYSVIYVVSKQSMGKIPHIISELDLTKSSVVYLDQNMSWINRAKGINSIFLQYKPTSAFFYTNPSDVAAAVAFSNNKSAVKFQIDLTDHAFWIGINAFDYILESREMGASIAKYYREIPEKKILRLDCVPYLNKDISREPLPFDITREKYIFTGGALYKTLGDIELLYYKTIRHVLERYTEMKFLYVGEGDSSEIKKLQCDYPNRVFLLHERSDFFWIMQNCVIYINSYPMFGGLMMRYAALAHKIPVTLKHNNDSDGLLINQDQLGIEFDSFQDYINEIDLLLDDEQYRKSKEGLVYDSVMNEIEFASSLDMLIQNHSTPYSFDRIEKFDTTEFRKEYEKRFSVKTVYKLMAKKENIFLFLHFPVEFAMGVLLKIRERIARYD